MHGITYKENPFVVPPRRLTVVLAVIALLLLPIMTDPPRIHPLPRHGQHIDDRS